MHELILAVSKSNFIRSVFNWAEGIIGFTITILIILFCMAIMPFIVLKKALANNSK